MARGLGRMSRGRRAFADEDLRTPEAAGLRPGLMQMLAFGGEADRAEADTRVARKPSTRPRMLDALSTGGTAEPADADARVGREPSVKPGMLEALADGGDVGIEIDSDDLLLGHELSAAMDGFGGDKSEKVRKVVKVLKAMFIKWDAEPHEEGEHEDWEGGEENE